EYVDGYMNKVVNPVKERAEEGWKRLFSRKTVPLGRPFDRKEEKPGVGVYVNKGDEASGAEGRGDGGRPSERDESMEGGAYMEADSIVVDSIDVDSMEADNKEAITGGSGSIGSTAEEESIVPSMGAIGVTVGDSLDSSS